MSLGLLHPIVSTSVNFNTFTISGNKDILLKCTYLQMGMVSAQNILCHWDVICNKSYGLV